jgi:hypothetical protein
MGHLTMELYLRNLSTRYRQSNKKDKGIMLDEYCSTSGHSRKHAIKSIGNAWRQKMERKPNVKESRGKKPVYHKTELSIALKNIWLATDQMCGKRLKYALLDWLPYYEKHYSKLSDETKEKLQSISSATIDRVLSPYRADFNKGLSGTKPGSILKTQIPILTEQWDASMPGFVEADTVAHCGTSLVGDFIWSLTVTDINSGWTELRALWGKGATGVVDQMANIESLLPFTLKGFDCDNGSEFLNQHLIRHFAHPDKKDEFRLQFTRSRPYKKNDNAHVEQKNWTHVRQLLGYHRLDNKELQPIINELYTNEVSKLNNFFCPSVKLLSKIRIGAKIKKTHSKPMTPYQRLLQSEHIPKDTKTTLQTLHSTLDPFELRKSIETKLKHIFSFINVKDTKSRVAI